MIFFFLYNIKLFDNSCAFIELEKLITVNFFIVKVVKSLINSLYSILDYKSDFQNTKDLFYLGLLNKKELGNFKFYKYNSYNFLNRTYFFKNKQYLKNFGYFFFEYVFLYEFFILIKIFFFKLLKFFGLFFFKKLNVFHFKKILQKLFLNFSLKVNNFKSFLNKFFKSSSFNSSGTFLILFINFFCRLFGNLFEFTNFYKFFFLLKQFYYCLLNSFTLFLYFKFICYFFKLDLIENNYFFAVHILTFYIFKNLNLFENSKVLNQSNSNKNFLLNLKSSPFFLNKNFNMSYMTFYNRYLFKFFRMFLLYSNYAFDQKVYYVYLYNYNFWNIRFFNFFQFSYLSSYLTKRTNYFYFRQKNLKNFYMYVPIYQIFLKKIFSLSLLFKYVTNYPFYYLIFQSLNLQEYLYLPFSYRFASMVENFFGLINFQNFSENYEKSLDNLFFDVDDFLERESLYEEEEDLEEHYEFEYNLYKENDYFALYFIEDLSSIGYYISVLYDLKFGLSDSFIENLAEYDSLLLSLDYYKYPNEILPELKKNGWNMYLEDFSQVIQFYNFIFFLMNKQFFFDQFFDMLRNMSNQRIIENDFFLGQIHLPFPVSKLIKIPKRNDIIFDTFEFRIPWFFSSTKRFKYFPFLLDATWWWENWFLKQFHVRRDLVLENVKEFNPYFDLLFQFLEIYKKNNFLLKSKFDLKKFSTSLYNSDIFLVLIDRIFVSNIRKNFFLYYKTRNGFDFFFFNYFFFE